MGVGDANDSVERGVIGNDDRRRWIELPDVLHSRLNVTDNVAVGEMRRCSAVRSHGELKRARVEPMSDEGDSMAPYDLGAT